MAFDRFLIAPLNSGLEKNVKPWLIPEQAFAELRNVYNFRGRIRKRFGSILLQGTSAVDPDLAQLSSRLRINLGNTNGAGAFAGAVPGAVFKVGQQFSIGSEIFTVYQTGNPAVMYTTGAAVTHTYSTVTGVVTIAGAAATTAVYFYPAEPVMGLLTYERTAINDETTYAFDTQFAYSYSSTGAGGWARLGTGLWSGTNSQFFWATNYHGANNYDNLLFVTNYNATDGLKYWDGTNWNNLVPVINAAGDTVLTARAVLVFKDRLILLNTQESIAASTKLFAQRCRFSQNGDPTDAANAWLEDTPGRGGYIDAPTKEAIISAQFLRDRLIVFFERSTWELVYIGNQSLPFVWQKINTELGAESTFSIVPFDKVVLGIANVGIHSCNGANVERIDAKIPDEVFAIHNGNEGPSRVYGIRDYKVEQVYWTFPSEDENTTYPDRVLVYNYVTQSWALNDDSITAFGYFQNQNDITWQSTNLTWEEADFPWDDGSLQSLYRNIIAGNQEGFTFLIEPEVSSNAFAFQITDIALPAVNVVTFTVIDHNFRVDEYLYIDFCGGMTGLDGVIVQVYAVDYSIHAFDVLITGVSGTYTGGGTIARVSNIGIRTKEFNFYQNQLTRMYMHRIGFYVDRTEGGEVTVDVYINAADNDSMVDDGAISGALIGTSILNTSPYPLVPFEALQDRFWHAIYCQGEGTTVQLRISMSDAQITNPDIAFSDFVMNAFAMYVQKTTNYF